MTVQVFDIERGRRFEAWTSRKDFTLRRNVHSICKVSILAVGRDVSRQINEDGIVEF